jgi:hypothetical protein
MAGIGDLALVKLVGSILKKGKDRVALFMEHKEPQTYEEYKQTWEEEDKKGTKTLKEPTKLKVTKSDNSPKKETKTTTTKKSTITKAKTKSTITKAKTKATTTKKTTTAKKPAAKKESAGSKREAKIKLYTEDVKKHYGSVDRNFLDTVVKNLGPSIYRKDAELVSCTDPKELDTVRKNFCIKKLGFDKSESEMLDIEIKKVCESMKSSKIKYRATFYYILAKNLKKESALN